VGRGQEDEYPKCPLVVPFSIHVSQEKRHSFGSCIFFAGEINPHRCLLPSFFSSGFDIEASVFSFMSMVCFSTTFTRGGPEPALIPFSAVRLFPGVVDCLQHQGVYVFVFVPLRLFSW